MNGSEYVQGGIDTTLTVSNGWNTQAMGKYSSKKDICLRSEKEIAFEVDQY